MFSATAKKQDGTTIVVFGIDDREAERMRLGEACCFRGKMINMPTYGFVFTAEFPGEGYAIPLMECEEQLAFSFSQQQLGRHGMIAEIPIPSLQLIVVIMRGETTEKMALANRSLITPTTVVRDPHGICPFNKN